MVFLIRIVLILQALSLSQAKLSLYFVPHFPTSPNLKINTFKPDFSIPSEQSKIQSNLILNFLEINLNSDSKIESSSQLPERFSVNSNRKLSNCADKNCFACDATTNVCTGCNPGYDLKHGSCVVKPTNSTPDLTPIAIIFIVLGPVIFIVIFCVL
jgi:hypothetical protein